MPPTSSRNSPVPAAPADLRELAVVSCGIVDYETASRWQDDLHARRVAGEVQDVLLLLEHSPVYTMGRRSAEEHLLIDQTEMAARGIRLHRTDRGGSITAHGPGQLVAYPIVDLRRDNSYFVDVIKYVRLLEEAVIQTLSAFGVTSGRREGLSGVWVGREKIAAIGVRISRGIAKHGVAINVCTDLSLFDGIVPCGLATEGVTSMEKVLGTDATVDIVKPVLADRLAFLLGRRSGTNTLSGVGLGAVRPPAKSRQRPDWLKTRLNTGPNYRELKGLVRGLNLHTVCEEASCPNIYECWEAKEATFLILGKRCTRRCGFCDVETGKPGLLDVLEPGRVANAVDQMGLSYAVVTGVERDDVSPRAAASVWAATIRAIKQKRPSCGVEVLTGDLKGDSASIAEVLEAGPDVFAHNLETVRRLHKQVRPGFRYDRSVEVLKRSKQITPSIPTKSNLIAGLGETFEELIEAMKDLRQAGVDILTVGQYLSPSPAHLPVARWVSPEEFGELRRTGEEMGFAWVEAGPLVRSSYHAGRQHKAALEKLSLPAAH